MIVESPQITLWFPNSQISPCLENGTFGILLSISKSSSFTSSFTNILVYSSTSNPVSSIIPTVFNSSNKTPNFSISHSPLILLRATLRAFSSSLDKSTTTHSASILPKSFITLARWCPPIIVPSLFIIIGSTYPKCKRLFFIFSYSASPGFNSFLGLYSAGFNSSNFRFSIFIFFLHSNLIPPYEIRDFIHRVGRRS